MNSKVYKIIAFAQLAMLQIANAQSINRIIPGCGPNILPIAEAILPNQFFYPPNFIGPNLIDYPYEILPNIPGALLPNIPGAILPNIPGAILPNIPSAIIPSGPLLPSVLPCPVLPSLPNVLQSPTTTIIQDNSVGNSLANTLQLLVVSSLLANRLPQNEVIVPSYPPIEYVSAGSGSYGFGGYNYIY